MDRGAWWATVHKVTKSWTQLEQLTLELRDFADGPVGKNPPSSARDLGLIPGWGTKIAQARGGKLNPGVTTREEPEHHNERSECHN